MNRYNTDIGSHDDGVNLALEGGLVKKCLTDDCEALIDPYGYSYCEQCREARDLLHDEIASDHAAYERDMREEDIIRDMEHSDADGNL